MQTRYSLASQKWNNFRERFRADLLAIGLTAEEIDDNTWDEVAPHFATAGRIKCFVHDRDEAMLLGLAEASDSEYVHNALKLWHTLDDDRKTLVWRYMSFFLDTFE